MADDLSKKVEEWNARLDSMRQNGQLKDEAVTDAGIPVKAVYTPLDVSGLDYADDIGLPGEYPYVRGSRNTGYISRLWTMRQNTGFGGGSETNERLKFLMRSGETGLNIILDAPTHRWVDCDHEIATGQVGFTGVSISTLQDMEDLFEDIPLDKARVTLIAQANAPIIMAMYVAAAEKRGIALADLKGDIQNDPLREYEGVGCGGYRVFPMRPALKLALDVMEYAIRNIPQWTPVTVNGHAIREYQISPDMEAAIVLSNAREYLKGLVSRGLNVDQIAPRFGFFMATNHNYLFQEVAKFRACRYLWASMMKEEFHASDQRSYQLRIGTLNIGTFFTRQHALNNITRITLQTLAAVLGGCQSIATMAYDEALALPTEEAQYTSLCIQNIIAHETGITDTIDPMGGSYMIESITKTMRDKIQEWMLKIGEKGGVAEAVDKGFFQKDLVGSQQAMKRLMEVETGERVVVGVNKMEREEELARPRLFAPNPEYEKAQKAKLAEFKNKRDSQRVSEALSGLDRVISTDANVMPCLIEAVKAGATVGETGAILGKHYGEAKRGFVF